MDLSTINWLAVIVSAAAYFILGGLWFGPLFGKAWQKGAGLSDEEVKGGSMGKMFATMITMSLIVSFGMAMFFFGMGTDPENPMTAGSGAMMGAMTGVFFIFPVLVMNYVPGKRTGLIVIESLYHIICFVMVGAILGGWH